MQRNNFFMGLFIVIVSILFLVFLALMFSDNSGSLADSDSLKTSVQRSIRELTLLRQEPGNYKVQGFFVKDGQPYCGNKVSAEELCFKRYVVLSERSAMGDPLEIAERDDDLVIDGNFEGRFLVDTRYEFEVKLVRYNGEYPVLHYLSHRELPVDMSEPVCTLDCDAYTDLNCPTGCVGTCDYRTDNKDQESACVLGDCLCPNDDYFFDHDLETEGNIALACEAFPGEVQVCITEKNKLCVDSGGRTHWLTIDNKNFDICDCGEDYWNFREGCGNRCPSGICTDDSKRCHDSDNNSSVVVGTVSYLGKSYQDHCYNEEYAVEYGCNNDEKFENSYKCLEGCRDGQCVITSSDTRNCRDVDGIDYYNKSVTSLRAQNEIRADECWGDNTVIEYYCKTDDATEISKQKYACTLGCQNGACKSGRESCLDTDGGLSKFTKGTVEVFSSGNKQIKKDTCYSLNRVLEYYCDERDLESKIMSCPDGCRDGACMSNKLE